MLTCSSLLAFVSFGFQGAMALKAPDRGNTKHHSLVVGSSGLEPVSYTHLEAEGDTGRDTMRFVLASHNKGKLAEMQAILGELGVEVVMPSAMRISPYSHLVV